MKIDFNHKQGKIRRLNGLNLAPRLYGSKRFNTNAQFKALNCPVTRFHDAPLDNPGMRLVDPHLIFANWHADADDPRNYYFEQTDDYLQNCRNLGVDIHYRLGPSIEHLNKNYFIYPPEDYNKWIEICTNIIRHYNEGWSNGFHWDIKYWTIWEEPENKNLWNGEPEQFFSFFKQVINSLKKRFPDIKLGTVVGNHLPEPWTGDFLAYCRDEKVAMDFFGWSMYKGDLEEVIGYPEKILKMLNSYGFTETELHMAEWNYTAKGIGYSGRRANTSPEGCYGVDAAAFAAAVLTGWQDTALTMANYYTASITMGLFDLYSEPKKNYYGLLAFGEIAKFPQRVEAVSKSDEVKILAGLNFDGEGAILLSMFKSEDTSVELNINGVNMDNIELLCVDSDLNLEAVDFKSAPDVLKFNKKAGSAVFLIKGLKKII